MLLVYGVKNDNRLNCFFFNTLFKIKFNSQVKKNPSFSIDIFLKRTLPFSVLICKCLCIVFKRFKKGLEIKNTKKNSSFLSYTYLAGFFFFNEWPEQKKWQKEEQRKARCKAAIDLPLYYWKFQLGGYFWIQHKRKTTLESELCVLFLEATFFVDFLNEVFHFQLYCLF